MLCLEVISSKTLEGRDSLILLLSCLIDSVKFIMAGAVRELYRPNFVC
jgi:hypothetical protein